ncbi:MAG: hypothetical protein ACFFCS_04170 [Candidatus Hodarchaeota archaeon]
MGKLGKLFKTPTGVYNYEIESMKPKHVLPISDLIEKQFGFEHTQPIIEGLDTLLYEMKLDKARITVNWDVWSGLYVLGMNDAGSEWIPKIAEYLDSIEDELEKMMEE